MVYEQHHAALREYYTPLWSYRRSMPPSVPWMTGTDDAVLRLLDRADVAMPPKGIALNLHREHGEVAPSSKHVARRLRNELTTHGLVNKPFEGEARGYYAITDLGRRYFHDSDAESEEFIADIDDDFSSG